MRRKIWTKRESLPEIGFTVMFICLWYSTLIKSVITDPSSLGRVFGFLLAGLMPLAVLVAGLRRAFYYRRIHRECMNRPPRKGRIINCREEYYHDRDSRGRVVRRADYVLEIEVTDNETLQPVKITSEPYSWPVYEVLGSPEVDVYTDQTGWHYVIDGFHYKEKRSDPGIFEVRPFDRAPGRNLGFIVRMIAVIAMVCTFLNILFE